MKLLCNKKELTKDIFVIVFFTVIIFIFLLKSPNNPWNNGEAFTDSSVFKYVAMAMSKGQMPYRDTFDHKGPILYLLNYLGQMISFYRGTWVVEYIAIFIAFLYMYKIARLLCGRFFSVLAVLLCTVSLNKYYDGGNLVEEYAMPFIAISLYVFMDYFINQKVTRMRLIICGMSFACVFLLRPNMITTWIVFCIVVLVHCIRCRELRDIGHFIGYFLIGVAVIVLPILFWFLFTDTLIPFVRDYFVFNFSYASNGATLVDIWKSWLFFHDNILLLCLGVLLLIRYKKEITISYVGYLVLSVFFICISGRAFEHYGMVLVPAMAFPCALLWRQFEMMKNDGDSFAGVRLAIIIGAIIILPIWSKLLVDMGKKYTNRDAYHYSQEVSTIVNTICDTTDETDTITVYGNWDVVYLLTNRLSASRYSYQFPVGGVRPQIMDEYMKEIEDAQPKWVIVENGNYDERIKEYLFRNDYSWVYEDEKEFPCMLFRHPSINWEEYSAK